jgi:hypothetical protein
MNTLKLLNKMSMMGVILSLPFSSFAATETNYTQPMNDLYLIVGYPTTAVYNTLTGGSGGPPQIGLLGMFKAIADGAIAGINASGVTTCEGAPATGSFTGTANITLTSTVTRTLTGNFATPLHTIPTGHAGAGAKYDKRIEMTFPDPVTSTATSKAAMEFVCGKDQAYVELQLVGDSISGSYRTINMFIDSTDPTSNKVEFMMKVTSTTGTTGTLYDAQIIRLDINKSASTFNLNGLNFYYRSSNYYGYRVGIAGTAAGTASTYLAPANFGATFASVAGTTTDYTTVAPTSSSFSSNFSSSSAPLQGCLNFTTKADPATTALCTGTTLATPSAPVVDTSGSFNFTWLAANMNTKVTVGF